LQTPATIDVFKGLSAADAESGSLSHAIHLVSGSVNWFASGSYNLVFAVTDAAGNVATFTRTVSLTGNAVFYPDYASWIAGQGPDGVAPELLEPTADPDGDGQTNAMEWVADTEPFDGASKLHLGISGSPGSVQLQWCGRSRIRYWIESTADMNRWQPDTEKLDTDQGYSFTLDSPLSPSTGSRRFFRLACEPRQPVFVPP
jgi:hypothetical protein